MVRKRRRKPPRRTHGSATTTPRVRRGIQASDEKNTVLAIRYGVNRKTIAKWKARESTSDERMGPKNPRSRVLTRNDEAIIIAYRWRTRLSLEDSLVRLSRLTPRLSRSALYRCLKRHGLSKIGSTAKCSPFTRAALAGPYCFEITVNEVGFPDDDFGVVLVFLAVEEVTRDVYAEVTKATSINAAEFLAHLVAEFPQKINAVTSDMSPIFSDEIAGFNEDMAAVGYHPFAVACRANGIFHTRTNRPKKRSRAGEVR
jgi:hypothetical protein